MPSWKKVILSGSAAHLLNITASNLPNIYKNNVLMYDTASGEVTYWTSSLSPTVQLAGTVKYDNSTAQTPMTNTTVTLMDSNGTQILPPTITDLNGYFNFNNVPFGNHYINFYTNKSWDGVNVTDVQRIAFHITNQSLTGIRRLAADVDADGDIDINDVTQVNNRISNSIGSFTAGDWVFGTTAKDATFRGWRMISAQPISPSLGVVSSIGIPLTASVNNTNLEYLALCTGDVNGSYTPPQ